MHTWTSATAAAACLMLAVTAVRPERNAGGAKSKRPSESAAATTHTPESVRPERSAKGAKSKGPFKTADNGV